MDPDQTEIWTILRMITWGTDYFKKKGVDSPRLTIELMLAHVLKVTRFDLYLQFDRPLISSELEVLRGMVRRRATREPLQYILGEAHFYRRTFTVNPAVLIPRPETELLVEEVLRRTQSIRCLDIGTGSGCIGITIALERPETEVVAIDASKEALEVAVMNGEALGAKNIQFQEVDFFDDAGMRSLGTFDLIVSNPPYVPVAEMPHLQPEVRDYEPRLALTDDGDGYRFYRRFLDVAPYLLRSPGTVFFELGFGHAPTVRQLFTSAGYEVDVLTDLDRVERFLYATTERAR